MAEIKSGVISEDLPAGLSLARNLESDLGNVPLAGQEEGNVVPVAPALPAGPVIWYALNLEPN